VLTDWNTMAGQPRVRRVLTVRNVVLLAISLPVAVVGVLIADHAATAGDQVRQAEAVEVAADEVSLLVRARAAVAAEQRWAAIVLKLDEIGIEPTLAQTALGVQPDTELRSARTDVDDLLASLDDAAVADEIRSLRRRTGTSSVGSSDVTSAYGTIVSGLSDRIQEVLGFSAQSESADASTALVRIGASVDAAAQWQAARADQLTGWMAAAAGVRGGGDDPAALLLDATARSNFFEAELQRLVEPGSATATVLNDASAQATDDELSAIYGSMVESIFESGAAGAVDGTIDIVALMGLVDEFVQVNRLAADANAGALRLVDASLTDLAAAATGEREDASDSRRNAFVLGAALFVGLLLLILLVSRMVIRPLARVASVASAMQQGSLDQRAEVVGLHETRVAAAALNAAVEQMALAESQALALAEARLDDPVLEQSLPGLLGTSLQQAVASLRDNLSDRDDFERRLEHEAAHDALTGLPNRRATIEHLERALARSRRSEQHVAALFVDIDYFKDINDRYGHEAGDELLKVVSNRMRDAARDGDLVGRIGGDEFLLIAEPVRNPEDAALIADRILGRLAVPVTIGEIEMSPTASVGVAVARKDDQSAEDLVRSADLALYRAKEAGRARYEVCDDELRTLLEARAEVTEVLGGAIDHGELLLTYQPVVNAATKEVTSVEALVRWDRPGVGLVTPDEFIPQAERGDLIIRLDRWVLREAARQLALWQSNPLTRELDVAVNISGRHLSSPTFVADVLDPLRELGVPPRRLIIELTESALVDDLEEAANRLRLIKVAGVRVALDDFGTGYASLAHLRALPIDILKIDRSFVAELDTQKSSAFVTVVVDTGRLLDVLVVGEGVETADQAAALVDHGCDLLQGFFFGRPGTPRAVEELMAGHLRVGAIF